jgi:F-type H+-transporting ATPase subunit b
MKRITRLLLFSAPLLVPTLLLAEEAEHAEAVPQHVPPFVWFHLLNLTILVFVLYRLMRKPFRDFLVKRQDTIREALEKAESARIDAERQNELYRQRLAGLSEEIATLRMQTETVSRAEADQLIASATSMAARIETDTQRLLKDELARARYQLRQEAIDLAIKLAEGLLAGRITESDQRRLAEEYLQRVGNTSTEIH